MRLKDLKTDGTVYRAEIHSPIEKFDQTDGGQTVVLLDLDAQDAPQPRHYGTYDREKKPIKARVLSGGSGVADEIVYLSPRRVLRTEEDHQRRLTERAAARERHKRELEERNRANATIERKLKAALRDAGLDDVVAVTRDTNRALLSVRLNYGVTPEKLLETLTGGSDAA